MQFEFIGGGLQVGAFKFMLVVLEEDKKPGASSTELPREFLCRALFLAAGSSELAVSRDSPFGP